jgi:hypothetical protein
MRNAMHYGTGTVFLYEDCIIRAGAPRRRKKVV